LEQQITPEQVSKDDRLRYVEELASPEEYPGDAWISITDAARITRTSEAMARRWVTSGRLPVRKEPVGLPPRTRLVRISDVAKIRPIIDPTAAITDEVRKLDLPSIPRQQQQIVQDNQRLLKETEVLHQETANLHHTVEQLATETHTALETLERRITTQQESLSSTLEAQLTELRDHFTGRLEEISSRTAAHHSKLEQLASEFADEQRQLQEVRETFSKRLATQDQEQQTRLQEATIRLDAEREAQGRKLEALALEQAQSALTEAQRYLAEQEMRQQAALEVLSQEVNRALGQVARDLRLSIETLFHDQAQKTATFTSLFEDLIRRLEQISIEISAAKKTLDDGQQRATEQEQRIKLLQRQLEEEREARLELSQQLAALVQSVNALHAGREIPLS
jgi:chromosome segregation ATPase